MMETNASLARKYIQAFDLTGVELTPSRLKDQYQQTRNYYLTIPNNDMLFGFRQRANLPSPGKPMGGWYYGDAQDRWYSLGHCSPHFGQWMSAFSRMAIATGDQAMREKALNLMNGWSETIAADGYCGAVSWGGHTVADHYFFEKLVCGLVDIAAYLHNEDALRHLKRITTWAIKNLSRRRVPAGPPNPSGESYGDLSELEWYTLSENLYRAYLLSGDEMYRDFAEVWHYDTFWFGLAEGKDVFPGTHAYSHVNTLSSAAMTYAVTGRQQYLDTIIHAYDILKQKHLYATGGYGNKETFMPAQGFMRLSLWDNMNPWGYPSNFEAPCGSWAVFKLCRYLMEFTGDARFGDWMELMIYNGIGAALPMSGYGKSFYYSDYKINGGSKTYYPELWPCCSGTYPQAVTEYHNLIYLQGDREIYINLFIPSKLTWECNGRIVEIEQLTDFPESDEIKLSIHTPSPVRFPLHFRVPAWSKGNITVKINQEIISLKKTPGTWSNLDQEWHDNDTIEIVMPLELHFQPIDTFDPHRAALMAGPVVLVADKADPLPGDPLHLSSWFEQGYKPLSYTTQSNHSQVIFQPYYRLSENEKYFMYVLLEHAL